jgi:hypothetical protein
LLVVPLIREVAPKVARELPHDRTANRGKLVNLDLDYQHASAQPFR